MDANLIKANEELIKSNSELVESNTSLINQNKDLNDLLESSNAVVEITNSSATNTMKDQVFSKFYDNVKFSENITNLTRLLDSTTFNGEHLKIDDYSNITSASYMFNNAVLPNLKGTLDLNFNKNNSYDSTIRNLFSGCVANYLEELKICFNGIYSNGGISIFNSSSSFNKLRSLVTYTTQKQGKLREFADSFANSFGSMPSLEELELDLTAIVISSSNYLGGSTLALPKLKSIVIYIRDYHFIKSFIFSVPVTLDKVIITCKYDDDKLSATSNHRINFSTNTYFKDLSVVQDFIDNLPEIEAENPNYDNKVTFETAYLPEGYESLNLNNAIEKGWTITFS